MAEKNWYLVRYTKGGNSINIHVYANTEDEACIKADEKFYAKYNKDAIAGFVFDEVVNFGQRNPEEETIPPEELLEL